MLSSRKLLKRRSSRRRKLSVASAPTEGDATAHAPMRQRRDAEAHRNFASRRPAQSPRSPGEGGRESAHSDDAPASDDGQSESDDEFYITAVHSTFSNCEGVKKSKSKTTRRTASDFMGPDAPSTRIKDNLERLGRYTKDVVLPAVKGVLPDPRKLVEEAEETADGYAHAVRKIVGLFYTKEKGEPDSGDTVDSPAEPTKDGLLSFLTSTSQLKSRSPRRQDRNSPSPSPRRHGKESPSRSSRKHGNEPTSRAASECSSVEYKEFVPEMNDDVDVPIAGVNRNQRSLRSSINQWQRTSEVTSPLSFFEEEKFFELPDTPRLLRRDPKILEYTSLLGTSENATRIFVAATVVLLAAVVYHFQLFAVLIFLTEMFAGDSAVPVMAGTTLFMTFVTGWLVIDKFWKRSSV